MTDFELQAMLQDANAYRQGYNPYHALNPHHRAITAVGYMYSHTTLITGLDGDVFPSHAYRYPHTSWVVGVDARPGYIANAHKLGSGRMVTFTNAFTLGRYLKRKAAQLKRLSQSK